MMVQLGPFINYVRITDDVMSDDVITGYSNVKKWPFSFIFLLLRNEVWTYSNQLAMFLDRFSMDPPGQIFDLQPSQNSRGDWIGPSNINWH